jgi:hypothetical protein
MSTLTKDYFDQKLEEQASLIKQGFDGQSKRIDALENRIGGVEANLKQDIADLEGRFDEKLQETSSSLLNAVDAYAKKANTFFEELVAIAHRMDRHEKWIHQIADKLGVRLEY